MEKNFHKISISANSSGGGGQECKFFFVLTKQTCPLKVKVWKAYLLNSELLLQLSPDLCFDLLPLPLNKQIKIYKIISKLHLAFFFVCVDCWAPLTTRNFCLATCIVLPCNMYSSSILRSTVLELWRLNFLKVAHPRVFEQLWETLTEITWEC